MKFLFCCLFTLVLSVPAQANSVILMIGDGMGLAHIVCLNRGKIPYIQHLPFRSHIITSSANSMTTDSAAAATAMACGIKTNNKYIGLYPDSTPCPTIVEQAAEDGYFTAIVTTDKRTGATPAAFYAHAKRDDTKQILEDLNKIKNKVLIRSELDKLAPAVDPVLQKAFDSKEDFLIVFEGAMIDKHSHANDLESMRAALLDFDDAVAKVMKAILGKKDVTLVVTADHETGGLNSIKCNFTTTKHTARRVPLYALGQDAELFQNQKDNTDIYNVVRKILFYL